MRKSLKICRVALGLSIAFLGYSLFGESIFSFLADSIASQLMGTVFIPYAYISLLFYTLPLGIFTVLVTPVVYATMCWIVGYLITFRVRSQWKMT
jgi:hypothetical protein